MFDSRTNMRLRYMLFDLVLLFLSGLDSTMAMEGVLLSSARHGPGVHGILFHLSIDTSESFSQRSCTTCWKFGSYSSFL